MEEVGFSNGYYPEDDLGKVGVFGLTLIIAFFEGINDRYATLNTAHSRKK